MSKDYIMNDDACILSSMKTLYRKGRATKSIWFFPNEYEPYFNNEVWSPEYIKQCLEFAKTYFPPNKKIIFIAGDADNYFYESLPEEIKELNIIECWNWKSFWLYNSVDAIFENDVSQYKAFGQTVDNTLNRIPPFSYHYASLVGRGHNHKCMLMDELYGNGASSNGLHSWNRITDPDWPFKNWNQEVLIAQKEFNRNLNFDNMPFDKWKRCFFSLIMESTPDINFITEKTWHTILCFQPFLVFGKQGCNQHLTSQGFLLYDEYINYSFDTIEDDQKRAEAIAKEVKRLCKFKQLDRETLIPKLKHNFYNALNLVTQDWGMDNRILDLLQREETLQGYHQIYVTSKEKAGRLKDYYDRQY